MKEFVFRPELFECRTDVLEVLSDSGFDWFTDYGAIDLRHDTCGLEVTGICDKTTAAAIAAVLEKLFPEWQPPWKFYEDRNVGEIGWKVIISRDPED